MSEDQYRNQLNRYRKEQASVQKKRAEELRKSASVQSDIDRITRSLNSSSSMSASSGNQKRRQLVTKQKKLADHQKKVGDYDDQLARVQGKITTAEKNLGRATESRQDKEAREAKRRRDDEVKHRREMERRGAQERRQTFLHERTLTSEARRRSDLFSPRVTIEYVQRLPEKLVVLFVAANPRDQNQLRLDEEVRDVTARIQSSRYGRSVDLRSIWAVRPGDLMEALSEHRPHVVHFSGHGSDEDEIVFLNDAGNTKRVSKDAITATIATTADHVRLVLFNTCYSRGQAESAAVHIEATIGMGTSIGDEAARVFAKAFYSAIGYGYSIARAFEKARAEVTLEGIDEEDTPELFTREGIDADEIVLVRPEEGAIEDAA